MFCILASNSPRRQEILRQMGIDFAALSPDVDETCTGIPAEKVPAVLAKKKLKAALTILLSDINPVGSHSGIQKSFEKADFVLAADTVIELAGRVYGKPRDKTEAAAFLSDFSGKTHRVITAIAVYARQNKKIIVKTVKTRVTFAKLSETEINGYLAADEWKDAAGAYKIQGRGACLITNVNGSYSGVVGLPVFELYDIIKNMTFDMFKCVSMS